MPALDCLRRFAAAALPTPCVLCHAPGAPDGLCGACLQDLPGRDVARCPTCAIPTPTGQACGRCLASPPAYTGTIAAGSYAFPLDAMLSQFKYARNLTLAVPIAGLLVDAVRTTQLPDVVLPVPISRTRLRERGFNQAAEIGRVVARVLHLRLDVHAVSRRDGDPPQASLALRARTLRIRGAFRCLRDLQHTRVALVDDVMTSGATLNELASTLRAAGAREVQCWVVARTS